MAWMMQSDLPGWVVVLALVASHLLAGAMTAGIMLLAGKEMW